MAYVPEDVVSVEATPAVQSNETPAYEMQNPLVQAALAKAAEERSFEADVKAAEVKRAATEAENAAVKALVVQKDAGSTIGDISSAQKAADDAKDRLDSAVSSAGYHSTSSFKVGMANDAILLNDDEKIARTKIAKARAESTAEKAFKVENDDKSTIGEIAEANKAAADAKGKLESLVDRDDDRATSKADTDLTIDQIAARLNELGAKYGIDPQNGKFLGSPPGELPEVSQIMSNLLYGRSQRPDPRLDDLTPEELYDLEIGQQFGSSIISNGIIFGLGSSVDDLAAQYAPGYLKFPAALAGKVAIGRVVNPIAQEGSDIISDWQGDPNAIPGPGIVSMENLGDAAPSAVSIVIGSAAGSGVKQLALAAAAAGVAIPDPVTTLLGLGTAMYVGSEIYVAADNHIVPDLLPNEVFVDPVNPPTIEEYEVMLAEHFPTVPEDAASATVTDEVLEKVTPEEIEAVMPTLEQLEVIWGPKNSSDSPEELETGHKWPPATESNSTLELGPKYPPVVLEEPAERPGEETAAEPRGESVPEETLEESAAHSERVTDGDPSPKAQPVSPFNTDDFPVRPISELPETWKTFVDRVKGGFDQVRDLATELPQRFYAAEETGPRLIVDTRPIPDHLKGSKPSDELIFTLGDIPRLRENDDHHRGEGIGGVSPSCKIDLWMAKYVTELLELGVTDLCQFEGWTEKQLKSQISELQAAGSSPDLSDVTYAVACTFGHEDDFQFLNDRPDVDYGVDLFQM